MSEGEITERIEYLRDRSGYRMGKREHSKPVRSDNPSVRAPMWSPFD